MRVQRQVEILEFFDLFIAERMSVTLLTTGVNYETIIEASQATGVPSTLIVQNILGYSQYAGYVNGERYRWMLTEDYMKLPKDKQEKLKTFTMRNKKRVQLINTGEVFDNIFEVAHKFNRSPRTIKNSCLKGTEIKVVVNGEYAKFRYYE